MIFTCDRKSIRIVCNFWMSWGGPFHTECHKKYDEKWNFSTANFCDRSKTLSIVEEVKDYKIKGTRASFLLPRWHTACIHEHTAEWAQLSCYSYSSDVSMNSCFHTFVIFYLTTWMRTDVLHFKECLFHSYLHFLNCTLLSEHFSLLLVCVCVCLVVFYDILNFFPFGSFESYMNQRREFCRCVMFFPLFLLLSILFRLWV